MQYVGDGRPRSAEEVAVAHAGRLARARDGLGFWAGFTGTEFVGWWLLTPATDDPRGDAELGYRLDPSHWKRGYATEGAAALLTHGFQQLGLRQVFAEAMAANVASRAVMNRLGMRQVGTRRPERFASIPGSDDGEVDYVITLEEWQRRTAAN